jgi:type III pantothenate kinase
MALPSLNTDTILAIDAGNTRVKWGLFDATGAMLKNGACLNAELITLALPAAHRVLISNVAGNKVKSQLENLLSDHSHVNWLNTQSSACGVTNSYTQPETLGTDRWAALIAAWHMQQAPCVVVNAGTAVTIDALSVQPQNIQAEFIGGLIMPGLNLMQQSLGLATAQLPMPSQVAQAPHQEIFAKNTADAIQTGALQAICGAIILMAHELNAHCKQAPYIVISGGNAQIIKDTLIKDKLMGDVTNMVLIVDNLVLHGLYLLANFMRSEQQ